MSTATVSPTATSTEMTAHQKSFIKKIKSSALLRVFMFAKLPLGWMSGMRVVEMDTKHCVSVLKLSWLTRNPFGTTYFAALAMAAELSNGSMTLMYVDKATPSVATFPVGMKADFTKAAKGRTYFTCDSGEDFENAVKQTQATGEPVSVDAVTIGRNEAGEEVCRFTFTWSFKRRG